MKEEKKNHFETAFARLETILEKLNSGNLSLDESIALYEEADKLIQCCNKKLLEAEKKIETLIKNREGKLDLDQDGNPMTKEFAPQTQSF